MTTELPITELPDGSGCFTATILSKEEAMALPLNQRPLCYRISGEIYHAVFEAVGQASMCWDPIPSGVFDASAAEKLAVSLCFKIADEIEKQSANTGPGAAGAQSQALCPEPGIQQSSNP